MKQYYRVGSKTFKNFWAGLRESAQSGHFCEYIIPDDYKQSFLDINPQKLSDNYTLMNQKAEYLLKNYKCRLHYSGGIDSHTLVTLKKWPMYYMYLRGLIDVRHVDEEYMFGYDYLIENNLPNQIRYITLDDYNVWKDLEAPFKYADYYNGISPTWLSGYAISQDTTYDLEVTGYEKPLLYRTKSAYYWLLSNGFDTLSGTRRVDFFLDDYFPELAVKQVYTYYNYFLENYPNKFGFITWKSTQQLTLLKNMGRDINRPSQPFKSDKQYTNNSYINYKQLRQIQELQQLGRQDILTDWINCTKHLIETIKSAPYGIDIVEVQIPELGTVQIPKKIDRIGAIYKILPNGLKLLDHTDINLLT